MSHPAGEGRRTTRDEVIAYCRRLQAEHLVQATAGNVSARIVGEPDLIAMTPTGFAYDALEPDDICLVSTEGAVVDGRRRPTSELPLHTLVYARRPEVGAVIHTHSAAATTMAVLGWTLPPILTGLVEAAGGDVRTAPYSRPGTAEMADLTAAALEGRGACFMRHHGLLAVGADLARAFLAASLTEAAARVYLDARSIQADILQLAPGDVERIARRWRAQWQRDQVPAGASSTTSRRNGGTESSPGGASRSSA
jgi:L-fuculose-phosphate aldolase